MTFIQSEVRRVATFW